MTMTLTPYPMWLTMTLTPAVTDHLAEKPEQQEILTVAREEVRMGEKQLKKVLQLGKKYVSVLVVPYSQMRPDDTANFYIAK